MGFIVHFVQNPADILAMVFDVRDSVIVLRNRVTTLLDARKSHKASMIHKLLWNVKKVTMDRTVFPHVDIHTSGKSVNSSVIVFSLGTSKAVEPRQVFKLVRQRNVIYFKIIRYMYILFPCSLDSIFKHAFFNNSCQLKQLIFYIREQLFFLQIQ